MVIRGYLLLLTVLLATSTVQYTCNDERMTDEVVKYAHVPEPVTSLLPVTSMIMSPL